VRRFGVWLVLLLACAEGVPDFPAPGRAAGLPGPRRGGTLRLSLIDDVRTVDPAIGNDESTYPVEHMLFDTLVAYASARSERPLDLVPQLAESWTVSADRLTYDFTLRENLRYADGSPIVAADFVTAIERVLDPAVPSPGKSYFLKIAGAPERQRGEAERVSGLRALDDRHLRIQLSSADESFLYMLALKFATPVPARWLARVGAEIRERPLASGPYTLIEWRQGAQIRLARNPHYWKPGIPYIDAVELDLAVPRDAGVLRLLAGELDAVDRLSSGKYVQLMKSPTWKPHVRQVAGNSSYGELLNVERPPFSGPHGKKVRQAMNYAVDKRKTMRLYNDRAQISNGLLPPILPAYDAERQPYPYDPDRARQLLREAGYPDGFDITYYCLADELLVHIAESMQYDLSLVGIRMQIRVLTMPTHVAALGRRDLTFAYTGWIMDFPHPWNFLESKFHSRSIAAENSNNDSGWSSPETDRLLDLARVEPDPEKAKAMYRRVEAIVFDEAPWLWHYHSKMTEVVQPYVKDYAYHPVHMRDFREAWLDRPGTQGP
jgi:peptide/nickel transport system substrate-binding protein/oligopeptide transport system substrate-binding protein